MTYEPRIYRRSVDPADLTCFEVVVKQTDILVCAEQDLSDLATDLVHDVRRDLERYLSRPMRSPWHL